LSIIYIEKIKKRKNLIHKAEKTAAVRAERYADMLKKKTEPLKELG